MLDTNLLAPMLLTQALLPHLRAMPRAQVIFVGSALGRIGLPGFSVYSASKFGLRGFAEALRRELGDSRVRVQYLGPRSTRTAFNDAAVEAYNRATGTAMDPPEGWPQALLRLLESERAERFLGFPETLAVRLNGLAPALAGRRVRQAPAAACRSTCHVPVNLNHEELEMHIDRTDLHPRRLRRFAALALCFSLPPRMPAPVDDAVAELQHDWEVIRYQTPPAEREKRFEALAAKAHKVSESLPGRSEPLIWEGIIVSSLAGEKGGLGALGLVKQAKALYEAGDPDRRQRARRLGLQQPGRPLLQGAGLAGGLRRQGQGAASCCRRRWRSIRRASTPTSSTASTWSRPSSPTRPSPTSSARCRRRRGRAGRSPTPGGARRRARCWRRSRPSRSRRAQRMTGRDDRIGRRPACRSSARAHAARRCAARSTCPGRCRFRPGPSGR